MYFIHTSGRFYEDTLVHVIGFEIKPSFNSPKLIHSLKLTLSREQKL